MQLVRENERSRGAKVRKREGHFRHNDTFETNRTFGFAESYKLSETRSFFISPLFPSHSSSVCPSMASLGFPSLLLLSSIFMFASAIASPRSHPAPKVSLALYYETLCPDCSSFIVNDLSKIFNNELIKIIDLKLVPYGNSKKDSNGTLICQHGKEQCFLNIVEACIIDMWPTPLEDKYGKMTGSLTPPHEYFPWVTVNGLPLLQDFRKFISYVCEAYKGKPVPEVCKKHLTHQIIPVEEASPTSEVSFPDRRVASPPKHPSPPSSLTKKGRILTAWSRGSSQMM
ncbi:gamma-interferon-responsive lysosomal thiol protein-like [Macadamia integrifolia]|uniref:gamma-interferon-responsive lysosomal thiol protein-like n=1 Tax=Macadamia integrifolia TaxID=60698 RepID=UPI001C4E3161|nr:gamma-interferon-responsive lysosomal thiol protein-like [Macadamia integrifolia]